MNYWVHYNMSLHQYKTVPKNLFMSLNVIDLMRLLTFLHSIICIDLNKTHSPWFWIWVYWSASQTLSLAHWRSLPVQALVSSEWSLTGPSRPQTWVHIYSVYFVYRVIIKITKTEKKASRHSWTRDENRSLFECYNPSNPSGGGSMNRMWTLWIFWHPTSGLTLK